MAFVWHARHDKVLDKPMRPNELKFRLNMLVLLHGRAIWTVYRRSLENTMPSLPESPPRLTKISDFGISAATP
jgi:hypothetical protein